MKTNLREILIRVSSQFFFIFFLTLVSFANDSVAQRQLLEEIDIRIDNAFNPVLMKDLVSEIESKSDFKFAYSKKHLKDVSILLEKNNWNMEDLLKKISVQGRFSIKRVNETIALVPASGDNDSLPQLDEKLEVIAPVSGTITDESGEPLPGATVLEKGTANGTTTDIDGNYTLNVPDGAVLLVSFVGYITQEVAVNGRSTIDISMEFDVETLQEVVVVGYGTQEAKDVTGAIISIGEEAMTRQPAANNITELLRGTLPGLDVGISTNAEGSSSLLVRGPTSFGINNNANQTFGTDNSPLIVVDDVIFQGDLSSINPSDIENISVLKDASAAAVYGSRASNGVIIVTTKKGSTGKPTVTISSSFGWARAGLIEEVYGPDNYLDYKSDVYEAFLPTDDVGYYDNPSNLPAGVSVEDWLAYDNLDPSTNAEEIWLNRLELTDIEIENYLAGRSIDWEDIIFQTGARTNNTVSISGGTENLSYYSSLGYVKNEGILSYQEFEAIRGRLNLESKITDFLSLGVNLQTSTEKSPTDLPNHLQIYERQSPFGNLFYDDGEIRHLPYDDALAVNPLLYEYRDNDRKQREIFSNIYAKVTLPFGFSYRMNFSNRTNTIQDYRFRPAIATLGSGGDEGRRSETFNRRWMVDNILNWNKSFGAHNFDVTFLANIEEAEQFVSRQDNSEFFPSDGLSYNNLGLGSNPDISNNDSRETADALMGRLSYGFQDKYYATFTVRRDGYSAFGRNNPRATFPAASVGWRLSEEPFLSSLSFIDNLKLRLSWGENGNRAIGAYSALARFGTVDYIYDQSSVIGLNSTELANNDLKWETTTSTNAGLDFSILDNRVSGSLDIYRSTTTDLLLERSLPDITGYNSVTANLGEIENHGMELSLTSRNMNQNGFSWNSNFSFWFNRNEIKRLYGDLEDVLDDNGNVIGQREQDDIGNDWYIGHAIDEIFDYQAIGIWQLGEEEEAALYGRQPGDVRLLDVNGDSLINFDDQVFQGYTRPRYRLTLRNDFAYKNFDLSIQMNALLGHKGGNVERFNTRVQQQRINKYVTPYWTEENPSNEFARLSSVNDNPRTTWYVNRSFMRIQNITLGYNMPPSILQKFSIQSIRLYANVQNFQAMTLGGWENRWDVETGNPTPFITTLGLNATF